MKDVFDATSLIHPLDNIQYELEYVNQVNDRKALKGSRIETGF